MDVLSPTAAPGFRGDSGSEGGAGTLSRMQPSEAVAELAVLAATVIRDQDRLPRLMLREGSVTRFLSTDGGVLLIPPFTDTPTKLTPLDVAYHAAAQPFEASPQVAPTAQLGERQDERQGRRPGWSEDRLPAGEDRWKGGGDGPGEGDGQGGDAGDGDGYWVNMLDSTSRSIIRRTTTWNGAEALARFWARTTPLPPTPLPPPPPPPPLPSPPPLTPHPPSLQPTPPLLPGPPHRFLHPPLRSTPPLVPSQREGFYSIQKATPTPAAGGFMGQSIAQQGRTWQSPLQDGLHRAEQQVDDEAAGGLQHVVQQTSLHPALASAVKSTVHAIHAPPGPMVAVLWTITAISLLICACYWARILARRCFSRHHEARCRAGKGIGVAGQDDATSGDQLPLLFTPRTEIAEDHETMPWGLEGSGASSGGSHGVHGAAYAPRHTHLVDPMPSEAAQPSRGMRAWECARRDNRLELIRCGVGEDSDAICVI